MHAFIGHAFGKRSPIGGSTLTEERIGNEGMRLELFVLLNFVKVMQITECLPPLEL